LSKEAYIRDTPSTNVRHTTARTCQKTPLCVKRDLQKRPMCQKRPTNARMCQKRPTKRTYVSKETYKRPYVSKETYKKDLHVSKETCFCQMRPTKKRPTKSMCVNKRKRQCVTYARQIYVNVYIYTDMCQKRPIFVKRGLHKRHTLRKRAPHYQIYEDVSNIHVNNFFAYTSVSFGTYLCNTLT